MEPIFGFFLYLATMCVVGIVAGKRGLRWWVYELACIIFGPLMVAFVGTAGGSSVNAGFAAFLVPVVVFIVVMASNTSEREAVVSGKSKEYKKCPFCAEAVRREATKCKHCGSALQPGP